MMFNISIWKHDIVLKFVWSPLSLGCDMCVFLIWLHPMAGFVCVLKVTTSMMLMMLMTIASAGIRPSYTNPQQQKNVHHYGVR